MFACIYDQKIPDGTSLVDFAYGFSPLVEDTAVDTVVIDIEGCELLFGSAYELANEIANRATKSREASGLGCRINVAVASNPDAAIHAARLFKGVTFISPGEELTCLGELPVEALCPELSSKSKVQSPTPNKKTLDIGYWALDQQTQEILETLKLWGVRTFRDFAALPTAGVSERLGQEGVKLQQLAAGKTERHLKLKQAAPVFEKSIELEHPLAELEPLSFIFARLLNQLCASLNAYALATNELRVQMKLEDQTLHERKLNLPYPMHDHKVFLKLLLLETEMHLPQAAVSAVSIACEPVKPRVLQNGLFIPLAPEPEKLELTLARLTKLVGPDNIGSPELVGTHRPGAFRVKRFVVNTAQGKKRYAGKMAPQRVWHPSRDPALQAGCPSPPQRRCAAGDPGRGDLAARPGIPHCPAGDPGMPVLSGRLALPEFGFRVFRPPLGAMVQADRGYPTQISAWGGNRSVYGKVARLSGPWRTTGDWWRNDRWARDEWDVAVESRTGSSNLGGHTGPALQVLYRIYRELRNGSWFVEGIYD